MAWGGTIRLTCISTLGNSPTRREEFLTASPVASRTKATSTICCPIVRPVPTTIGAGESNGYRTRPGTCSRQRWEEARDIENRGVTSTIFDRQMRLRRSEPGEGSAFLCRKYGVKLQRSISLRGVLDSLVIVK